ncbi:MAG: glucose-6-phosphate dehydrogenase [Alphaproteobacteria bacterium]|nr:glucose-6-phosphate dehydrogenase [Alphaproteobacteria bacterium]
MSPIIIPVETFDLVVFGGTGDLARRKLLPALYHRDCDDQLPEASRIVGISRSEIDRAVYRQQIEQALREHVAEDHIDESRLERFLGRLEHVTLDAKEDKGWSELAERLDGHGDRIRVFYLATAPSLFGKICEKIGEHDLNTANSRVVLEKPIGRDLASAKDINTAVGQVFAEDQTYRIDHYLGKETVQNLMVLRFANTLFEPLWNATAIDHVQITVAETIGVEGRGGYYDRSGALRDMVQNHILQLLCLVAMEPPTSLDADAVRDEKLKVLRALKPITGKEVAKKTVRGQYRAGASNGAAVPGYLEEIGGEHESRTETFVALKAEIENWRWSGVPFYLRTGKRLAARTSEIVVHFKSIPHSIFPVATEDIGANRLIVRLQPDEGMEMSLTVKEPGPGGMRLRPASLNLSFAEAFKVRYRDAYERLLMDVVRGNPTLFMRRDEVEAAWSWIEPVITAWNQQHEPPRPYTASTWGPSAAIALIERDGRTWYEI